VPLSNVRGHRRPPTSSYAQGEAVWGRSGMRTLWSAATVKLLGAGLDEAAFVEDVSRLVGEHDVPADSWSHGAGRTTRTNSTRPHRTRGGSAVITLRVRAAGRAKPGRGSATPSTTTGARTRRFKPIRVSITAGRLGGRSPAGVGRCCR